MKSAFFAVFFLFVLLPLSATPVFLTNKTASPIVFRFDDSGSYFVVPAYSNFSGSIPDDIFRSHDGFFVFASVTSVTDVEFDSTVFEFSISSKEVHIMYDGSSFTGVSVTDIRDPVSFDFWQIAWQVVGIGAGMVVVPFTLSMALRAVRRGLNTNLPLS